MLGLILYYDNDLGIHASALKHGVSAEDAILAATEYIVVAELAEHRELRLGFDSSGRLLETVVIVLGTGQRAVIHAMPARRKLLALLEGKK